MQLLTHIFKRCRRVGEYQSSGSLLGCVLAVSMFLTGCASQGNVDPFENANRSVHKFNETTDRYLLKPLAQGYRFILPAPVELGISNVFSNLDDPQVALNQLLQGKPKLAFSDFGRFVVNSTIGIGGLFDPASTMGLLKHTEDFGQTFAVWGIPQGAYIVLPFWGPSTPRGGVGSFVGGYAFPPRYLDHVPTRNTTYGVSLLNTRANLLNVDNIVTGDRYIFLRDAYLQRRDFLINDGAVDDDFLDDFDDE